MITKDPETSISLVYTTVKTQFINEIFPLNDDQAKEVIQSNKALREEFLQNIRTFPNMRTSLYKYRSKLLRQNKEAYQN